MPIKIEREEDRQLPRWVYAMMSSKADPTDTQLFNDSPKLRNEAKVSAENFYKQRKERLREQAEMTSRISGLEWKIKPKNTFTTKELDQIIPERQVSYVLYKLVRILVVMICVLVATTATAIVVAAVCAEIKVQGTFDQAVAMFKQSPVDYLMRVKGILQAPDS